MPSLFLNNSFIATSNNKKMKEKIKESTKQNTTILVKAKKVNK
jgi:hypothetical protein